MDQGYPIVLSAEATVPSQTTQRPPQLALMNPSGEAMKIHEIRFSLKCNTSFVTGAVIGCKFDIGSVAITNGFIPVWNFGRVLSYDQDLNSQFTWRLAYPMYIPAGGVLMPNFQHFGQIADSVTARVSYYGASMPNASAIPSRVFLPYVSAYIGKAFVYETADTDTSKETDLVNPFDTDLRISRLVGRFNLFYPAAPSNTSRNAGYLLRARVSLSNGDPLVRTPTPFPQIFGEEGRAWEQRDTILKPKQYFQVFVDKEATADVSPGTTIQPYVSLVGYRSLLMSGVKA